MKKSFVGPRLATYTVIPTSEHEKKAYAGHEDKMKFLALSVGNMDGQVAIFPIDDFGEEQARKNAQAFCDLLNSNHE